MKFRFKFPQQTWYHMCIPGPFLSGVTSLLGKKVMQWIVMDRISPHCYTSHHPKTDGQRATLTIPIAPLLMHSSPWVCAWWPSRRATAQQCRRREVHDLAVRCSGGAARHPITSPPSDPYPHPSSSSCVHWALPSHPHSIPRGHLSVTQMLELLHLNVWLKGPSRTHLCLVLARLLQDGGSILSCSSFIPLAGEWQDVCRSLWRHVLSGQGGLKVIIGKESPCVSLKLWVVDCMEV